MIRRGKGKKVAALGLTLAVTLSGAGMVDTNSQKNSVYAASARQMENLNRGVIATKVSNWVYIGWRMFGTDSDSISFNVYRDGNKITSSPITSRTNYLDTSGSTSSKYYIRPVLNGVEQEASKTVSVSQNPYLNVPIQKPTDGTTPTGEKYTYSANDGTNIDEWTYWGGDIYKFKFVKVADNKYAILTKNSNFTSCIDLYNMSTDPGANICQWTYWGGQGQLRELVSA